MAEFHAYMWSVPDWRTDECYTSLDNREQGIYRNLIDECWVAGSIPADLDVLARFVREPLDYFVQVWSKIRGKFRPIQNGERLIQGRLEQDRRRLMLKTNFHQKNAKKAAQIRWAKHRMMSKLHATSNAQAMLDDAQTQTHKSSLSTLSEVSIPSVLETAAGNGRTNGTKPEYQKFWGPVESYLRKQVVDENFQKYYAGCQVVDMTSLRVVLAVSPALIQRYENTDATAKFMRSAIEHSGTGLLRDRALVVVPLPPDLPG